MPKPKFKEYVDKMMKSDPRLFEKFHQIHDQYQLHQDHYQKEFNQIGKKVIKIIREYEARLCRQSEGTYNQFTPKLAEKFQEEIRKIFPMIDWVGVIEKKKTKQPKFVLKKINLN